MIIFPEWLAIVVGLSLALLCLTGTAFFVAVCWLMVDDSRGPR